MISEKDFSSITDDGFSIRGRTQTPPRARASLVLCHGIGGTRSESGLFDDLVVAAAEERFATARFDFRGHGESDGGPETLTIEGEARDLAAVVKEVVDPRLPLFLVGASFGAGAVVRYAVSGDCLPAGIVLLNPVLRYRETFFQSNNDWSAAIVASRSQPLPAGVAARLPNSPAVISDALADEFDRDDTPRRLAEVEAPVLLIHGTDDTKVPFEFSKQASTSPHIEFVSLEGAQHGFRGYRPEVIARTITWIGRRIP